MSGFFSLTAKTLQGVPFAFDSFKGKVVLIVNVASKCGYTPQYEGLQSLYMKYRDQGLHVVGFPSTEFRQEYKEADQIEAFCQVNYGVTFTMMESVMLNGPQAHPVYQWLTSQKQRLLGKSPQVKWNFEKFLIDRQGNLIDAFPSATTPEQLEDKVKQCLEMKSSLFKLYFWAVFALAVSLVFSLVNIPIALPPTFSSDIQMNGTPSFYSFACKTLQGQPFLFESLRGKTVLIVNVASKCGYAKQYPGLQSLYDKYKDKGFIILGFPSNDFFQEYKLSSDISSVCEKNYGVTFPIMELTSVNGDNAHPVYKWLTSQQSKPGLLWGTTNRVRWNFEKYLVDKQGQLAGWAGSPETPESLEPKIQQLLSQN